MPRVLTVQAERRLVAAGVERVEHEDRRRTAQRRVIKHAAADLRPEFAGQTWRRHRDQCDPPDVFVTDD